MLVSAPRWPSTSFRRLFSAWSAPAFVRRSRLQVAGGVLVEHDQDRPGGRGGGRKVLVGDRGVDLAECGALDLFQDREHAPALVGGVGGIGVEPGHAGLLRKCGAGTGSAAVARPGRRRCARRCGCAAVGGAAGSRAGGFPAARRAAGRARSRRARSGSGSAAARSRCPTGRLTGQAATAGPPAGRPAAGRSSGGRRTTGRCWPGAA